MNRTDKQGVVSRLDPAAIDPEFLPFLERINRLPFCATVQCCIGHMKYEGQFETQPPGSSGRWGYLQLFVSFEAAEWLMERIDSWDWLWVPCSQLWIEDAMTPGITDNGSFEITFAWDAQDWPRCAEDICAALEEYGETGEQEQA